MFGVRVCFKIRIITNLSEASLKSCRHCFSNESVRVKYHGLKQASGFGLRVYGLGNPKPYPKP